MQPVKETKTRATRINQSSMPYQALRDSLTIARVLYDELDGMPSSPAAICKKINVSPTSSRWRDWLGASNAYGLTTGLWNAKTIMLTPLGSRVVAPRDAVDEIAAKREAVLTPEFLLNFYTQYDGETFPEPAAVEQVMHEWGLPGERAVMAYATILHNGEDGGLLQEESGTIRISLAQTPEQEEAIELTQEPEKFTASPDSECAEADAQKSVRALPPIGCGSEKRVLFSCGENRTLQKKLETFLKFGSFEPVTMPTQTSMASTYDLMRTCGAAIFCVDKDTFVGNEGIRVASEIGAAVMAYGCRTILLYRKGFDPKEYFPDLPRCEYEGDQLDCEAIMQFMEIFNGFKNGHPA